MTVMGDRETPLLLARGPHALQAANTEHTATEAAWLSKTVVRLLQMPYDPHCQMLLNVCDKGSITDTGAATDVRHEKRKLGAPTGALWLLTE